MAEMDFRFTEEKKQQIVKTLMRDKLLPDFQREIERVSYMDGCKVYFKNGGWIIARFSGTEPLMRIFCEMSDMASAIKTCNMLKEFLQV